MANHLKVAMIELILKLHELRWSNRRIAHELGIHRDTVARHLRLAGFEPAKAPPGSGTEPPGISAVDGAADNGDLPARTSSECEPYRELIKAKLQQGLSAKRIHQDLVADHHFTAKYHSVRRFVKRLGASEPLPFRRLECAPGEEAQVDFGTAAPIVEPDGRRRRPHVLRVVLSHSRKAYSEAVLRQTTDNFLLCLENAFWHFGGVPKTLVLDNLRAAVTNPDWFDPDINPKVRSFAEHYGIAILPTKSYTPRHKGKVERGIGYVKDNALKGRVFNSLADENRHLLEWEQSVAGVPSGSTDSRYDP